MSACAMRPHDGAVMTSGFYDDLAGNYHLIYQDWESAIEASSANLLTPR